MGRAKRKQSKANRVASKVSKAAPVDAANKERDDREKKATDKATADKQRSKQPKKSLRELRGGNIPPIIRKFEKVGRNSYCPCGSTYKLKDCCKKVELCPRHALVLRALTPAIKKDDCLSYDVLSDRYILEGAEPIIKSFRAKRWRYVPKWMFWVDEDHPNYYPAENVETFTELFIVNMGNRVEDK